jgi:mannose-6-phosphate isomerase-like protein (cupin superfamily)
MHIRTVQDIQQPLTAPWGEVVYELVGAAPASGQAALHSLAHIIIPPGKSSQVHYHKVSEETYYILSGTARMVIDGREITLVPAQACLIQPGERHQIFNPGESNLEFLAVCAPAWSPQDSYSD